MVKLYYTPTSCGAASFITAHAAGLTTIETEQVNLGAHKTLTTDSDYYAINPKGNVPCLVLDDGTILNEGAAVLQYIADLAPASGIAPPNGTTERALVQVALNWVASELHASIGGLFNPTLSEEVKTYLKTRTGTKLKYFEENLLKGDFLVGDKYTIADAYGSVVAGWGGYVGIDMTPYPKVQAYVERCNALPIVVAAKARMAENPAHI